LQRPLAAQKKLQEQYGPNLALISADCNPGETTDVKGESYYCSDYDFIIGDFWPNPDRYKIVDFSPPWLTTSISTMKYNEKAKNPTLDVTTLTEATRARVPVCALESSYVERIVTDSFPDVNIVSCTPFDNPKGCVNMLKNEECALYASDELDLRSLQTQYPYFEMTGELMFRQLLAWPIRKNLDRTAAFLLNKWIYAAISNQVINELYFDYFEKKLCPIGTAGVDCELPCDPDHGSSNAQGRCVCNSIRWIGDDCSVEVAQELNLIPPAVKRIAYGMFALNTLLAIIGGIWLRAHWDSPEVKYSQPFFLYLVLVGCIVSTSTILAMVQEDEGDGPVHACIAIPWLYSVGFSITFGTLFAKIYRVYGIFLRGCTSVAPTRRSSVSFQDTLLTIGKVLLLDVVILGLWTGFDPLHWQRFVIQQDQFGFTLESQGLCTSEDWKLFLGALVALHVALCIVACYMCYVSRNIPSRFSEHKYLTIAMVSNLQVFAIGVPVLVIAEDDPAALCFVRSAIVWMNDFVVLVLIFGNLIYAVHFSKANGEITGRDKVKVSEALKRFDSRRDGVSASANRKVSDEQSGQIVSNKIKAVSTEVSPELDMENKSAGGRGTQNSSDSLPLSSEKCREILVSDLSMSGFEGSTHGYIVNASGNPLSAMSKSESAARWVPAPGASYPQGEQVNSDGLAKPTRRKSVIDPPEESNLEMPSEMPLSNSSDDHDIDSLDAKQAKTSQQYSMANKQHLPDGALDERLTCIAELEWSDEEENLTNTTPPALLESAPEQAPVMPVRFESEFFETS